MALLKNNVTFQCTLNDNTNFVVNGYYVMDSDSNYCIDSELDNSDLPQQIKCNEAEILEWLLFALIDGDMSQDFAIFDELEENPYKISFKAIKN